MNSEITINPGAGGGAGAAQAPPSLGKRLLFGGLLWLILLITGVAVANAWEIMPSVGVSKAVHVDNAEAEMQYGLSVRGTPFQSFSILRTELGVAYRQESTMDDQLTTRMWPITVSAWLTPGSQQVVYAGGGVGWYQTTLDYDSALPVEDVTNQDFGVHLGGGLGIPLGSKATVDLNGRYVFMKKQSAPLPPEEFDPDFWTTSVGLAFRL
ncbi:MAG: outer membrane beta-barrel protein [Candidatus Eiseniibacteriota bacterium]